MKIKNMIFWLLITICFNIVYELNKFILQKCFLQIRRIDIPLLILFSGFIGRMNIILKFDIINTLIEWTMSARLIICEAMPALYFPLFVLCSANRPAACVAKHIFWLNYFYQIILHLVYYYFSLILGYFLSAFTWF